MSIQTELQTTINDMVQKGNGILAADESAPTIEKRFQAIDVKSTEENRRYWRSLLITTPNLGDYISGIITLPLMLLKSRSTLAKHSFAPR